jgi:hypothetical protein
MLKAFCVRVRLPAGLIVLVCLTGLVALADPSAPRHAQAAPAFRAPQQTDSFYRYAGDQPLGQIRPGTVLKTREAQLSLGPLPTPATVKQLLYRSTDQLGKPTVTVTTVIAPSPLPLLPRVVGYLSFYDDLGGKCAPSYTLTGGDPGAASQSGAVEEELLIAYYVANGWIVTVPDYEGPHLHWMAAREAGQATLDAVRATESALGLGADTKVGLSGYSGGAVAADWAAELAPTYAPHLNIVGVAAGGVPVDYEHMFRYANGSKVYSAALPGMLIGLARAYRLDLGKYLSPYGRRVVREERHVCIGSAFGDYPGLTYQRLLKPRYRELFQVPAFARIFREQRMGRVPGHPNTAMLMGSGDIDGYGDGVMSVRDVIALAQRYCRQGVAVEFHRYGGAGHQIAGAYFEPQTAPFLQARFAGLPFTGNCGSIRATG